MSKRFSWAAINRQTVTVTNSVPQYPPGLATYRQLKLFEDTAEMIFAVSYAMVNQKLNQFMIRKQFVHFLNFTDLPRTSFNCHFKCLARF